MPASGNIPCNQSRGVQVARLFHWLAKSNLIRAVLRSKRIRATDHHAFPWSRGRIHRAQRTRRGTLNARKEADTTDAQAIGNKLIGGTIPRKDHGATGNLPLRLDHGPRPGSNTELGLRHGIRPINRNEIRARSIAKTHRNRFERL